MRSLTFIVALNLAAISPLRAGNDAAVLVDVIDENSCEAVAAAEASAITESENDIRAGRLRIRDYGESNPDLHAVDLQTGYRM